MRARQAGMAAWGRLLRLPNLFTVPGDPLAGYALATGGAATVPALAGAVGVALCLYVAGLLLNDLADLAEDRRDRPGRPLPAGTVSPGRARLALAASVTLAGLVTLGAVPELLLPVSALAALITAYDLFLKRVPVAGEAALAGCRALSLLLGAWVAGPGRVPPAAAAGAAIVFVYVFGLSRLARHEVRTGAAPLVGRLVRGLILLQALLIGAAGHPVLAGLVAVLWVPATRLGRRYASS